MDKILTPQEWACKGEKPPTDVLLNSESVLEYAKYYHSKQPKKDIILPEHKTVSIVLTEEQFNESLGFNAAIDEVKRLNGIQ